MVERCIAFTRRMSTSMNGGQSRKNLFQLRHGHRNGSPISEFLLSSVATACGRVGALEEGKQAHCIAWKHGFHGDVVLLTSLVSMYSNCGAIHDARQLFGEMPQKDVVATNNMISGLCSCHLTSDAIRVFSNMCERDDGSWNSLISGLAQNIDGNSALSFFKRMRVEGVALNLMVLASVLSVCADLAALSNGRQVHGVAMKHGFELYLPVANATLDMYAKSGSMDEALLCFKNMPVKNVISWTSLIVGYGKQGLGYEAIKAFEQMEAQGVVPNQVTFLGGLYACSHAGLVMQGWRYFDAMRHKYSITPLREHYTCMVDILARAGRLNEANDFVERMPVTLDVKLLTAILSSCCFHRNEQLGRSIGKKLLELQPREAGAYALVANFYGLIGDLDGVANVRKLMMDGGPRKEKARTWIELNGEVHSFESSDSSHPAIREIYSYLKNLVERLKKVYGYVPNTGVVMQKVDDQEKEHILMGHCEKLAIGFGIISTAPGTPIRMVKNLRVCVDCHVFTGLISKIEGRDIVARDSSRFHHFKGGACSCGNRW